MNQVDAYADLKNLLSSPVCINEPLARYGTWKIGGAADILISPCNIEDVCKARAYIYRHNIPSVVIGDGSNILFDDEGFRGIVIHIGQNLANLDIKENGNVVSFFLVFLM